MRHLDRHHDRRVRWGALALATLLALSASGCGGDDDGDEGTSGGSAEETSQTTADDGGSGEAGAVEAAGFEFTPGSIDVAVGDEVTWTNGDDTAHTVTSDDDAFDLSLDAGATVSQTFDEAGEFPYHCSIHQSMTGTVVVAEA